jgi:hypothetical protein
LTHCYLEVFLLQVLQNIRFIPSTHFLAFSDLAVRQSDHMDWKN